MLGVRLFERSRGRRGLRLTAEGEELTASARVALDVLESGVRAAQHRNELKKTLINLGCGVRFSEILLPDMLTVFRDREHDLEVRVLVATQYVLHAQLMRGRIDVCLWRGPSEQPEFGVRGWANSAGS
jgi:DNA-binding transcriptional LysR family regulator